jgi:acetyl esterase/lipase
MSEPDESMCQANLPDRLVKKKARTPVTKRFSKLLLPAVVLSTILAFAGSLNAQQHPETQDRLNRILERFPQADANRDGVLTHQEFVAFNRERRQSKDDQQKRDHSPTPTHADVKYGDHDLQAFDLWLPQSRKKGSPTPLCIFIHGGGFRGGDKSNLAKSTVERFLSARIAFASMNYRLTNGGEFPFPIPMHDAARGLQFIRSRATEWNIDPKRIACYGGSAGAGISLWIAFKGDMAEVESNDPVARQSTRIRAAGALAGQSTYNMRTFRKWFGVPDLPTHPALLDFYAMKEGETAHTPRVAKLAEEASPINHLTRDDPPVYMCYNTPNSDVTQETSQAVWVHHPLLGLKLQEAMRELDIECIVETPETSGEPYDDIFDFLIRKVSDQEKTTRPAEPGERESNSP